MISPEELWTKKEIDRAAKIIKKAKENKSRFIKLLDKLIFWLMIPLIIIGNILIIVFLTPALVLLKGFYLYLTVAFVGISFGALFELLLRDIGKLDIHHHYFYGVVVPVFVVVSFFILGFFLRYKGIIVHESMLLMGVVYAFFFLVPYVYNFHIKKAL